jgi:hypothetical protein
MATAKRTAKKATKPGVFTAPKSKGPTVAVRTPNVPNYTGRVDAAKYEAMKKVLLKLMPAKAPGLTQSEMMAAIGKAAPQDIFPARTYMWWGKCVQLDLEAQGLLVREDTKPLRWHRK